MGIAQALLNDPEVLILDEPTSGLDPGERVRFRNLLSEFASDRIVLISTHIVSDVEYIASRNAVMKEGRIIAQGTTDELLWEMEGKVWSALIEERGPPQIRAEGTGGEHPERGERSRVHPVSGGRARGSGLPAQGAPGWRICTSGSFPRSTQAERRVREMRVFTAEIRKASEDQVCPYPDAGGPLAGAGPGVFPGLL